MPDSAPVVASVANESDSDGLTPLIRAVRDNDFSAVSQLLSDSPELNARSFDDMTALMYAIVNASLPIASLLVEAGAEVDFRNAHGRTALMYAVAYEQPAIVQMLLLNNADVNIRDCLGQDAISHRIAGSFTAGGQCVRMLKRAGGKKKGGLSTLAGAFKQLSDRSRTRTEFDLYRDSQVALHSYRGVGGIVLFGLIMVLMYFLPVVTAAIVTLVVLPIALLTIKHAITSNTAAREPPRFDGTMTYLDPNILFVRSVWFVNQFQPHIRPASERTSSTANRWNKALISSLRWSIGLLALFTLWVGSGTSAGNLSASAGVALFLFTLIALAEWTQRELAKSRLRQAQALRDAAAQQIVDRYLTDTATTDSPEPFAVYLRSFNTTGKLLNGPLEVETALAYAFNGVLNIVALGEPGEHIGAGRALVAEAEWQKLVAALLRDANRVVMLPSTQPGTMWELEHLVEKRYLDKTVFMMPPRSAWKHLNQNPEKTWHAVRDTLAVKGVDIPAYRDEGLIFACDSQGRIASHAPFLPPLELNPERREELMRMDY